MFGFQEQTHVLLTSLEFVLCIFVLFALFIPNTRQYYFFEIPNAYCLIVQCNIGFLFAIFLNSSLYLKLKLLILLSSYLNHLCASLVYAFNLFTTLLNTFLSTKSLQNIKYRKKYGKNRKLKNTGCFLH